MEEALYGTPVMRRIAGIGEFDDVPDETTILNVRRLLERHGLAAKLLAKVNAHRVLKGLSRRKPVASDSTCRSEALDCSVGACCSDRP